MYPLSRHFPASAGGADLARDGARHADARPYLSRWRLAGWLGIRRTPLRQCRRWEAAGADQLVFGLGMAPQDQTLETIRLMGEYVIPKIDKDPVHRTTRFREIAALGGQ